MTTAHKSDPVFVVDADGTLITAVGIGSRDSVSFSSDNTTFVQAATFAADAELEVEIIHGVPSYRAGWDTEEGILAALMSVARGRTYIKEVPESLLRKIHNLAGPQEEGTIY